MMDRIRPYRFLVLLFLLCLYLPDSVTAQDPYPDKIFPRSADWSVKCKIYHLSDEKIMLKFPNHDEPKELSRIALRMIEYGDGRQVIFNKYGEVDHEIDLPKRVTIESVLNPGLLRLDDGTEIILNGIDFQLPADSTDMRYFREGIDYLRSLIEGQEATLQFDVVRRDSFGRYRAYLLLAGGAMINTEILRRGYCPLDRGTPLIYLNDFALLEEEAKKANRGIWSKR